MRDALPQVIAEVARVNALVPAGVEPREYLAGLLDEALSAASAPAMGVVAGHAAQRRLASARFAVELIDDVEALAAKPEGIVDLGVCSWLLRPALPLGAEPCRMPETGPWREVDGAVVDRVAPSVGRIDLLVAGFEPMQVGTAFAVGSDGEGRLVVMTNAHVVDGAQANLWGADPGVRLGCDFARFAGGGLYTHRIAATEYRTHAQFDLALLFVEPGSRSPSPLTLATAAPEETYSIGVIGHPSFDSRVDPFPRTFGFGEHFGVKRFSPGQLRELTERLWRGTTVPTQLHDASTLSGSSGSCLVDLRDGRALGLHFGGWPQPRSIVTIDGVHAAAQLFFDNGAVPLWLLADDPIFAGLYIGP